MSHRGVVSHRVVSHRPRARRRRRPSPSGSPNPADYGADRGPARRARRPARVTVRFFDEKAAEETRGRLEKINRSPVDVLRERTAALNLRGGSDRFVQNQPGLRRAFVLRDPVPRSRGRAKARPEHAPLARRTRATNTISTLYGQFVWWFCADAFRELHARAIESTRDDNNNARWTAASRGAGTGRDVAVCYANRAATRLMLAAESTAAGHPNGRPNGRREKRKRLEQRQKRRRGWRRRRRGSRWRTAARRSRGRELHPRQAPRGHVPGAPGRLRRGGGGVYGGASRPIPSHRGGCGVGGGGGEGEASGGRVEG